jgi:hypothetical protein
MRYRPFQSLHKTVLVICGEDHQGDICWSKPIAKLFVCLQEERILLDGLPQIGNRPFAIYMQPGVSSAQRESASFIIGVNPLNMMAFFWDSSGVTM